MRYRLLLRGDGAEPGWDMVPDDHEPAEGEALADGPPTPGEVWDEASGALRPRTDAEILESAKAAKVEGFVRRGIDDLAPLFTPGAGRDETALLIAAHVLRLCEALGVTPDPRLAEVVSTGERALQKKVEVEAAQTVEELEGVSWT